MPRKEKLPVLQVKFWRWILCPFALVFLPLLMFALWFQPLYCSDEEHKQEWTGKGNYSSANSKNGTIEFKLSPQQASPQKTEGNTGAHNPKHWYCIELKPTDIALVFFTYCLVIVGWFTMRSDDDNTKRAERAYLVVGPLFGVEQIEGAEKKTRQSATMYTGPWRLTMYNFGRTAAYAMRIDWGICPECEIRRFLDNGTPVSEIIEKNLLQQFMMPTVVAQLVIAPTGQKPHQLWHAQVPERGPILGKVVFGRVLYKDVFRVQHFSTFSILIDEEHALGIGRSYSDDHDQG
jgi:hypothetical protein